MLRISLRNRRYATMVIQKIGLLAIVVILSCAHFGAVSIILKMFRNYSQNVLNFTTGLNITEIVWDGRNIEPESITVNSKIIERDTVERLPRNFEATDHVWRSIGHTRGSFFVYSAFLDMRGKSKVVRVIAAAPTRTTQKIWCHYWDTETLDKYLNKSQSRGKLKSIIVPGQLMRLNEHWNLEYSAYFIICPVTDQLFKYAKIPSVSLISSIHSKPTNRLVINNFDQNENQNNISLGICVKPIHNNYRKVFQFLEFLELNSVLGASHVTFYYESASYQIDCILRAYMAKNFTSESIDVEVLNWELNLKSQIEIRTEGMFASLNDCLYRNMYKYTYLLFIDLDEFVIPRSSYTIPELLESLKFRQQPDACSIGFQNTFFYLNWNDAIKIASETSQADNFLITIRKLRRRKKIHQHGVRSKYIVKPMSVVEVGNHRVWQCVPEPKALDENPEVKMRSLLAPSNQALLHHYRVCEFAEGSYCVKTANIIDNATLKYHRDLTQRFLQKYDEIHENCGLLALRAYGFKNTPVGDFMQYA